MRCLFEMASPIAAVTCLCVAITLGASCRTAVLNSWQGASASVDASGNQASYSGATAAANTGGDYSASSIGASGQPLTIGIGSAGSASASGNAYNLLTASTSLSMGETGVLTAPINPSYPIGSTASWNNDALIVQATAGTALPSTVQLQFKVDLSPDAQTQYDNGSRVSVGVNGQVQYITPYGYGAPSTIQLQPTQQFPGTATWPQFHQTGAFDITLALHPNGVSDPFSLSVSSGQSVQPNWWTLSIYSESSISLSLTGVTLPDGTPLTAAGYGVSFASGLTLPVQPVPEPGAFVVWGLLAAVGLTLRRRVLINRAGH